MTDSLRNHYRYGFGFDQCRSPWTNQYEPVIAEGTVPSGRLRKLEVILNDAFDKYRELLSTDNPTCPPNQKATAMGEIEDQDEADGMGHF